MLFIPLLALKLRLSAQHEQALAYEINESDKCLRHKASLSGGRYKNASIISHGMYP